MLAVVVTIVGGLVWFIATRPKVSDGMVAKCGEWSFLVGLIFTLWQFGGKSLY